MAKAPVSLVHPVVWTIHAKETPRVRRRCPRCDAGRDFLSSGRFRLNAQKRRVDVWLVYRCPECDDTWNATILERKTPEEIGPAYVAYQDNDPAAARRAAFAVPGADLAVPVRVERPPLAVPALVMLTLADPVVVRLDRLLARELGVPRAEIARRIADSRIAGDLRSRVADGQRLLLWAR